MTSATGICNLSLREIGASTILSLDDNTLKGYLKDNNQSEDLLDEYKKQINDKLNKILV